MEAFSVTISLVVLCLFVFSLIAHLYGEYKERKKTKKQREKLSEEILLRLVSSPDMAIKGLHRHVHKFQTTYDDSFIEAVDEEMKRRGFM